MNFNAKWNVDRLPALWHLVAELPTCTKNICRRNKFCPGVRDYGDPWNKRPHNFLEPGAMIFLGK